MSDRNHPSDFCRAFTLNEMLIVVAIIVLMLGLAIPAFNVMRGSKSIEASTNQISAFLGQARAEAIGVQEIRGVMFFKDPATGQVSMAIVRDSGFLNSAAADVKYLDLVPDRDFITLPAGLGFQTVDNATGTTDDRYIGFNATSLNAGVPFYGGVILFDSYGKLVSVRYGFRCSSNPASDTGTNTTMATLLKQGALGTTTFTATDITIAPAAANHFSTYSQIGFVVFDREAFLSQGGTDADEQMNSSYNSPEPTEETWLDSNASLFLINRYNGSLMKGE